jgi:hypothetical protein
MKPIKNISVTLPRHAGKVEVYLTKPETLRYRNFRGEVVPAVVHAIARSEIELGNIQNLIGSYDLQQGPEHLRSHAGRCIFSPMGFRSEEDELYLIPAVRNYFQHVTALWPHWLFSSCFFFPSAVVIALCCIETLQVCRKQHGVTVTYDADAMESFFEGCLKTTAILDFVAGISREESVRQLGIFRRCVGLPV